MTQLQLDRAVARSTGESLRTIRHRGFSIQAGPPRDLEPEDLRLAVDCPYCGHPCGLPAAPSALGECGACDVEFDFRPDEVYAAAVVAETATAA